MHTNSDTLLLAISWMKQGLAFILGALVGSFLNVVIHRVPLGESVVRPRSHCPHCGDMIPFWLNVPILSWLVLLGRCRKCRTPISPRYPIVELMTGLLWLASVVRFGTTLAGLAAILLASGLVVITFVDLDHWEIPDEVSLPGIVVGVVLRPFAFETPFYDGLLGAAVGAGLLAGVRWVYFLVRKKEGMGFGDVKLIGMIGAFLGPAALIPTILVASFSGSFVGIALLLFGPKSPDEPVPSEPAAGVEPAAGAEPPAEAAQEGAGSKDEGQDDEEDDWVPPKNAVPFGPFLALGALAELFFGPLLHALMFARF